VDNMTFEKMIEDEIKKENEFNIAIGMFWSRQKLDNIDDIVSNKLNCLTKTPNKKTIHNIKGTAYRLDGKFSKNIDFSVINMTIFIRDCF